MPQHVEFKRTYNESPQKLMIRSWVLVLTNQLRDDHGTNGNARTGFCKVINFLLKLPTQCRLSCSCNTTTCEKHSTPGLEPQASSLFDVNLSMMCYFSVPQNWEIEISLTPSLSFLPSFPSPSFPPSVYLPIYLCSGRYVSVLYHRIYQFIQTKEHWMVATMCKENK